MEKNTNFLTLLKKGLTEIEQQHLPQIINDLEKDVVHGFLFSNVYSIEEKNTNQGVVYNLIDLEGMHDANGYSSVDDFLYALTGNDEWNEDYGFESYRVALKTEYLIKLSEYINTFLEKNNVTSLNEKEREQFSKYFEKTTNKWWDEFANQSFSILVEKHQSELWEENRIISEQLDYEQIKTKKEVDNFEKLLEDWKNFIYPEKNFAIKKENTTTLNSLNEWAKNKSLNELGIFEKYYIKEKKLSKFKWLKKEIYQKKKEDEKQAQLIANKLFKNMKVKHYVEMLPKKIINLYKLRQDIFNLEGNKLVQIDTDAFTETFYIDKYNRVNSHEQGIIDFVNTLEEAFINVGAIVVRQISNESYETFENGERNIRKYYNAYGAIMIKGIYRGLAANELHDICVVDQENGQYLGEEQGIRFYDWNIGDMNNSKLHKK